MGDGPPLGAGSLRSLLSEGRGDEGAGHPAAAFSDMSKHTAHEVDSLALQSSAQHLCDGSLDALNLQRRLML